MLDALQSVMDNIVGHDTKVFLLTEVLLDNDLNLRYSTLSRDEEIRGVLWRGAGNLLSIEDLQETGDSAPEGATIILSGNDESIVAVVLREHFQDRPCRIFFGVLDENDKVIGEPFQIYAGFCDTATVMVQDSVATVKLTSESHAARWSSPSGAVYNDVDQQARHPGDRFFEYGPQVADQVTTVKWPTKGFYAK